MDRLWLEMIIPADLAGLAWPSSDMPEPPRTSIADWGKASWKLAESPRFRTPQRSPNFFSFPARALDRRAPPKVTVRIFQNGGSSSGALPATLPHDKAAPRRPRRPRRDPPKVSSWWLRVARSSRKRAGSPAGAVSFVVGLAVWDPPPPAQDFGLPSAQPRGPADPTCPPTRAADKAQPQCPAKLAGRTSDRYITGRRPRRRAPPPDGRKTEAPQLFFFRPSLIVQSYFPLSARMVFRGSGRGPAGRKRSPARVLRHQWSRGR